MPVRLRITLLFALLVMVILGMVCSGVYYFTSSARRNAMKTRLTNRSITTARLLSEKETFDQKLVQRIDSLTTIALKNKTVQAYDYQNKEIYIYSDIPGDTFHVDENVLDNARVNSTHYFVIDRKEAVAYHYADSSKRMVVISAAEDVNGRHDLHNLRNILFFSFLAGMGIILVIGYFFSGRLIRPIKKITEDVEEISAQNLTRRIITGKSKDEWNKLAGTLNELLNRLQDSFNLQRRFIANASHELSTPLTSISSQIEVSLQRERAAAEYQQTLNSVYQDIRHMNQLTQTLLEFAKAAGDPGGLEISLVRIDEILMRIPAEISKVDPAFSVFLKFVDLPEDVNRLLVFGNEALLFTAIRNIAINAAKYSDDHRATIVLIVSGNQITITVSDKGKGIPADKLDAVFQPFYRIEENVSGEGFGLGLSLAERIIKLHKGFIEVSSELNAGSRFTIHLQGSVSTL